MKPLLLYSMAGLLSNQQGRFFP